jgi:hypothetical protein
MYGNSGSKASPSLRWTPPRSRLAGMAGIAGGVVWITMVATIVTTMGFDALNFEPGTAGPVADATITISHSLMNALMLVAVLAANARYGADYGRLGRAVAYVLAIDLAVLVPVLPLIIFVFGEDWVPGGIIAGIAFITMHLCGSIFGIFLWRRTIVRRLTAGLFIAIVPAIIAVFVFQALGIGLPAATFESFLNLGVAALGYDLLRAPR